MYFKAEFLNQLTQKSIQTSLFQLDCQIYKQENQGLKFKMNLSN